MKTSQLLSFITTVSPNRFALLGPAIIPSLRNYYELMLAHNSDTPASIVGAVLELAIHAIPRDSILIDLKYVRLPAELKHINKQRKRN